jgi:hypothetical protein
MNLIWHFGVVGTGAGDVAGGADYRPTNAAIQVLEEIERDLAKAKTDYDRFLASDVPAFNKATAGKVPAIDMTPGTK